jgi:hypothetical protein
MRDNAPQSNPIAAALLARWLGPGLLLMLLAAWVTAWVKPEWDRQQFLEAQAAGRIELPPPPPVDKEPGIDNRPLDPADRSMAVEIMPKSPRHKGPEHKSPPNTGHKPPDQRQGAKHRGPLEPPPSDAP